MTSSHWWKAAALSLALAVAPAKAAPAPLERAGLAHVPSSAPLVIHIRGVEGLKDRLEAFLKNALPELLPSIQAKLDGWVKDGVDGRKVRGVPADGPIFIVLLEMPKGGVAEPPKIAVLVAVNKYDEFRDGLLKEEERKGLKANGAGVERTTVEGGEALYFVDLKGYAVATPSEEAATAFAKKAGGMDTKISKEQSTRLLAADLGLYVSMDSINKDYADQIKNMRDMAEAFLGQAGENLPKNQRAGLDLVKKAIGPIFQAVEDSQGVLLTTMLHPDGLLIHGETELRSGSKSSAALADFKLNAFEGLDRMPPGATQYTGTATTAKLLERLGRIITGVGEDEKGAKEVGEALEQLAKAGPGVRLESSSVPPAGLSVWHFEDPAKAVAAQLVLAKNLGEGSAFQNGILKEKPTIKEGAQKYNDISFNSVELTWDFDKMAEQAAKGGMGALSDDAKKQLVEAFKNIFGEKLHYWFGTDGKVYLQVTAKDWPAAEKLLDQHFKGEKGVGSVAAYRDVRKAMPAEATFLAVADLVQYLSVMAEIAKPMIAQVYPLPPGYPAKADKDSPNYMGMAGSLVSERGSFDLVFSASAVKAAFKSFVAPLMAGGAN